MLLDIPVRSWVAVFVTIVHEPLAQQPPETVRLDCRLLTLLRLQKLKLPHPMAKHGRVEHLLGRFRLHAPHGVMQLRHGLRKGIGLRAPVRVQLGGHQELARREREPRLDLALQVG